MTGVRFARKEASGRFRRGSVEGRVRIALLCLVFVAALLFAGGCGGASTEGVGGSVSLNSSSSDVVSGRVVFDGKPMNDMSVIIVSNEGRHEGFYEVKTSGTGGFEIHNPWPHAVIVAGNQDYVGTAVLDGRSRAGGSVTITMQDLRPMRESMASSTDESSLSSYQTASSSSGGRWVPKPIFDSLKYVFEEVTGLTAEGHFIERLVKHGISEFDAIETFFNGKIAYDPEHDNWVRWQNNIAISISKDGKALVNVIGRVWNSRWVEYTEEEFEAVLEDASALESL